MILSLFFPFYEIVAQGENARGDYVGSITKIGIEKRR